MANNDDKPKEKRGRPRLFTEEMEAVAIKLPDYMVAWLKRHAAPARARQSLPGR